MSCHKAPFIVVVWQRTRDDIYEWSLLEKKISELKVEKTYIRLAQYLLPEENHVSWDPS